jgi:uncharacterized membrane protein YphA (DoxX/SURF4 family)
LLAKAKEYNDTTYFFSYFMQKDCCSSGLGKWFCPSIVGVVAGTIMVFAGLSKFVAGKAILTWVGGAALGIFGIEGHAQVALYLGTIAAAIEVLWGLSIAVGCRKTSRWAALALTVVMAVALMSKIDSMKVEGDTVFKKMASSLTAVRLDLLLLAIFAQKALKLVKEWCGMGCCGASSCCTPETPKKK